MKISGNVFCGYYDVMALSADDKYLVYHKVDFIDHLPEGDDEAKICIFNIETNKEQIVDSTSAWNWQQGARLQWLGPDYCRRIAYNKFIDEELRGVIYDFLNDSYKIVSEPFYSISHDAKTAITLDFARLARTRNSYSYSALKNKIDEIEDNSGKGLTVIDIDTGATKEILSIQSLIANESVSSMNYGCHWIDMPLISPDGSCVYFLHRWEIDGGFFTRLYSIDTDGENLCLIVNSSTINHLSVESNDKVVFDGVSDDSVKKYRKYSFFNKIFRVLSPFYHFLITRNESLRQSVIKHFYYRVDKNTKKIDIVAKKLVSVAHPSINRNNNNQFLADTYEDSNDLRHLYMCTVDSDRVSKIASFSSPREFNSTKCRADLHPKWNVKGSKYCVDIIENRERKIVIGDLNL